MYAKLRPRRSTATEWSAINPVLMEGEMGVEYPDTGVGTAYVSLKLVMDIHSGIVYHTHLML